VTRDPPKIATLPMYDFPEIAAATDALWRLIARRLREAGVDRVPETLVRSSDLSALWQDEDLLLGQTCGYPLMKMLGQRVKLIATPIYAAEGCAGAWHRSAVIVRRECGFQNLADLRGRVCALNSRDSNTGMNLLRAAIAPLSGGRPFFKNVLVTGNHAASLAAVAGGEAEVAAVDCVSFALISRLRPESVAGLCRLAWTEPTPGLPLVTSSRTDARTIKKLHAALDAVSCDLAAGSLRTTLLLGGFQVLPDDAYHRVIELEHAAARIGYAALE